MGLVERSLRHLHGVAGLAAVLLYMAGQWRDVANFYKGRGAQYGTMSIVSIVVFLAF